MAAILARADELIKGLGRPQRRAPTAIPDESPVALLLAIVVAGVVYGGFMGSFALSADRALLILYVAIKVPVLILGTSLVCIPGFFILNTVLGLRDDLGRTLRAILAGQATLTVALAALAPVTVFVYISGASHRGALLFNAAMFTVAAGVAQVVLFRRYRALIAHNPRHRVMLWVWIVLYAFVGIQLGWMLRPFVGNPGLPVSFLRSEPFSNAYIVIIRLIVGA